CDSTESSLERANRELQFRADPTRVAPASSFLWPWSRESRARVKAQELSTEARLDIFKDDLRTIRIAREVLSRAATMRAVQAAETAIFEIQCLGETVRFAVLNRTHLEMTEHFLKQIEALESFRSRVTPEILDALKERALTEFSARMNRASKADFEFSKADILKVKP
ncbi:MAG TPA: hypothetical protein VK210_09265, partial [Terriglobia bacterium]|nr:hypothetical protein [Terriglobia bacterium]